MAQTDFSKDVTEVISTLIGIYRHQNIPELADLLESANPKIELTDYDNWNGGTYRYALRLDVPISVFASIESKIEEIEKSIEKKLGTMYRGLSNEYLDTVTITPVTTAAAVGPKPKPSDFETQHVWRPGLFRLFLSHVSAHKVGATALKGQLQLRGISGFVAHEDIVPSLEWQDEIELALRSMDALAALLTSDFHASNWTDQEVGFALGRGIFVVPVRLGVNPYGFIGKVQGVSAALDQPEGFADVLAQVLLSNPTPHTRMRKALVKGLENAFSYDNARKLSRMISTINDFTDEEKQSLQRACKDNNQVADATGVPQRICSAIGLPLLKDEPDTIDDSDIPF